MIIDAGDFLKIELYILLIILVIIFIVVGIKLIKTLNKVDNTIDSVNNKIDKLDDAFDIVGKTAGFFESISDGVINMFKGIIQKLINKKKGNEENEQE